MYGIEHLEHTCVAFGSFDGVHTGHQAVLAALAEEARRRGLGTAVISYACPQEKLALTTELEKEYLLQQSGVDRMLSLEELPGSPAALAHLLAAAGAEAAVLGEGSPYAPLFRECGIPVRTVPMVCRDGYPVTAERIARYLEEDRLPEAAELMGHPYLMLGKVVHGKALGRTVGMPTANLKIYGNKRRPPAGVYATRTWVDGVPYVGVTNVGTRPSVDDRTEITIETMLHGFAGDLYGERLMTEFHFFLRGIRKFEGIQAVQEQVAQDMERTLLQFSQDLALRREVRKNA